MQDEHMYAQESRRDGFSWKKKYKDSKKLRGLVEPTTALQGFHSHGSQKSQLQGHNYLHGELRNRQRGLPNVVVTDNITPIFWGGPSYLKAYLTSFEDILTNYASWKWDYVINYSETDFQLLPVEELVSLLASNYGSNFMMSNTQKNGVNFRNMQAFDWAFLECDNYVFKVGRRELPSGIWYDGGSDWFVLHKDFVRYATLGKDELVTGLKEMYQYSFAAAESFFQTLVRNSHFCETFRYYCFKAQSFNKKPGSRQCQEKSPNVDWGGCSPKVRENGGAHRLNAAEMRKLKFYSGRKFQASIDQQVINWVEANNLNATKRMMKHPSWNMYWESIFDPRYDPEPSAASKRLAQLFVRLSVRSGKKTDYVSECFSRYETTDQWLVVLEGTKHIIQSFVLPECADAMGQALIVRKQMDKAKDDRIQRLEVGTGYDVKNVIFRNYIGTVGDNPTLRLEWDSAKKVPKAYCVWLKPNGEVAERMTLSDETSVDVKANLHLPLEPGVWAVQIHEPEGANKAALGEIMFLVPGEKTTLQDVRKVYESVDMCVSGEKHHSQDCLKTEWSSLYPDLKSEFPTT